MKAKKKAFAITALLLSSCLSLCACAGTPEKSTGTGASGYLRFLDAEPASADPQCISENYTVALNIYDRLVEVQEEDSENILVPSLADSWEVSDDGLVYTFHLHPGIKFSNGSALTSEDVRFTLERLLTHPESRNMDLVSSILGASELHQGVADALEGFSAADDETFTITLAAPSAAFLEGLTTPGASILDKETTMAAGDAFGKPDGVAIGTGPFVLSEWSPHKEILMAANPACWSGAPKCGGLKMMFYTENAPLLESFLAGEIDILDLDKLDLDAEFLLRGDVYRQNIIRGRRVGITFLALNQAVKPLDNVNVRKALQLSLDRETLLKTAISDRGVVENGIFPHGLAGFNPDLPEIPYDPHAAKHLLTEAGYGDGFNLEISCSVTSAQSAKDMLRLAAAMWKEIGVNATVVELENDEFMARRRSGLLACYAGTWSADFNDPDNFISTFFGSVENTTSRSLCYPDKEVMERVIRARAIVDEEERIREYQALEKKLIQDDASWIPLYSRFHFFAVSDRVEGFKVRWNGWSSTRYDDVELTK